MLEVGKKAYMIRYCTHSEPTFFEGYVEKIIPQITIVLNGGVKLLFNQNKLAVNGVAVYKLFDSEEEVNLALKEVDKKYDIAESIKNRVSLLSISELEEIYTYMQKKIDEKTME